MVYKCIPPHECNSELYAAAPFLTDGRKLQKTLLTHGTPMSMKMRLGCLKWKGSTHRVQL